MWVGYPRGEVWGYAQFGERHGRNQATIGLMAHEIGHLIFGLPDLYDTDYSSEGIGVFGLMGGGTWGKKSTDKYLGQTPALPCAWTKHTQKWVTTKNVKKGKRVIKAAGSSATGASTVYKSTTGKADEYFLIEFRNASGYDKGLQYYLGKSFGGLAIWHVDDKIKNNKNDNHRWVDLEEAAGARRSCQKKISGIKEMVLGSVILLVRTASVTMGKKVTFVSRRYLRRGRGLFMATWGC